MDLYILPNQSIKMSISTHNVTKENDYISNVTKCDYLLT